MGAGGDFKLKLIDAVPPSVSMLERLRVWWASGWRGGRPVHISWSKDHLRVEERAYSFRSWRVKWERTAHPSEVRVLSWERMGGMVFVTLGLAGERFHFVLDNEYAIRWGQRLREELAAAG